MAQPGDGSLAPSEAWRGRFMDHFVVCGLGLDLRTVEGQRGVPGNHCELNFPVASSLAPAVVNVSALQGQLRVRSEGPIFLSLVKSSLTEHLALTDKTPLLFVCGFLCSVFQAGNKKVAYTPTWVDRFPEEDHKKFEMPGVLPLVRKQPCWAATSKNTIGHAFL